ncbi:TIGR00725 family protein [archaeon]|nr:TIGR00725 family protein [archaeon]MBL7056729.1 TIGR00725 family protein [Candidatus Woesearchaeota archaeon]
MKKLQIAVLGSSKAICTQKAYKIAEKVGEELAKRDCIVITGGGLGVMEAALKGAKKEGGLTIGIIPWESIKKVNQYADVTIATGIGWSRDAINVNSCDGAIIVHGGAGTLNEATYGYIREKPLVAIKNSGGIAGDIAGKFLDVRKSTRIESAKDANDAVNKVLKIISKQSKTLCILSEFDRDLSHLEDKKDWEEIVRRAKKRLKAIKK